MIENEEYKENAGGQSPESKGEGDDGAVKAFGWEFTENEEGNKENASDADAENQPIADGDEPEADKVEPEADKVESEADNNTDGQTDEAGESYSNPYSTGEYKKPDEL